MQARPLDRQAADSTTRGAVSKTLRLPQWQAAEAPARNPPSAVVPATGLAGSEPGRRWGRVNRDRTQWPPKRSADCSGSSELTQARRGLGESGRELAATGRGRARIGVPDPA